MAFPELVLAWCNYGGKDALRISGWTEAELRELQRLDAGELNRRLALLTTEALAASGAPQGVLAIAGRFEVGAGSVYFVPRFPFVAGMSYSLLSNREAAAGGADGFVVWRIRRPAEESVPTASVLAIYPDVAQVPVNLLKFYVQFSEPMSSGYAPGALRVCREDTGELIDGVFVPLDPELWDSARQRLTLLLDPARIKHGLVPNLEVGYPLTEGVAFRLFIDPEFRDAKGRPLRAGANRRYAVGPEVRLRIDPRKWQVNSPVAGSREPLAVKFERPLDYALSQRCLWVSDPHERQVAGSGETGAGELSWRFEPELPWLEGQHQLVVDRQLEDLAGNSPVRVFDRDMSEPDGDQPPAGPLTVAFTCVAG